MNNQTTYKRKRLNFAIKRDMQVRLLIRLGTILLLSLLICSTIYFVFSNKEISRSYYLFHIKADNFLEYLLPVVIASLCFGLLIGLTVALFFPKPIVGPLYRIERELREIGKGDLSLYLTVRKGDELGSLANQINEMVCELRGTMIEIQTLADEGQEIFKSTLPPVEKVEKLNDLHDMLLSKLNSFRLLKT